MEVGDICQLENVSAIWMVDSLWGGEQTSLGRTVVGQCRGRKNFGASGGRVIAQSMYLGLFLKLRLCCTECEVHSVLVAR